MKHILIERSDGVIVMPAIPASNRRVNETEDQFLNRSRAVVMKDSPTFDNHKIIMKVEEAELVKIYHPYFGNSIFRIKNGKIVNDKSVARAIKMTKLRKLRNQKLKDSDSLYLRETEIGNTQSLKAMKELRQSLRDMPVDADLNSLQTLDEIADFTPDVLKDN